MKPLISTMLFALAFVPSLAQAQESTPGGGITVKKYEAQVIAPGGRIHQVLGTRDHYQDADDLCKAWNKANPKLVNLITAVHEYEVTITPPRPPRIQPPAPVLNDKTSSIPVPPTRLEGFPWVGSENLQGYGRLEFRFQPNGQVLMVDAQATVTGTWYRNGNAVRLSFYNGNCVYYGTINGSGLSGRGVVGGKTSFPWSVSR